MFKGVNMGVCVWVVQRPSSTTEHTHQHVP